MKRILFAAFAVIILACASSSPVITPVTGIVLEAQSLPATVHVKFSVPSASLNVTGIVITLDGVSQTVTPLPAPAQGSTFIEVPITLTAAGSHTVTGAFTNQTLSTDPTSAQVGPVATVTFTLNAPVSTPPSGLTVVQ